LHPYIKFSIDLDGKIWHNVKRPMAPLLDALKTKDKLYFTTLNYTLDYTLHLKF